MRRFFAIAATRATAVVLPPLPSAAPGACVVAAVLPYLTGLAIATGVEDETRLATEAGADFYVSGVEFGRAGPLPRSIAAEIGSVPGISRTVPRIVGRVELGRERVGAIV